MERIPKPDATHNPATVPAGRLRGKPVHYTWFDEAEDWPPPAWDEGLDEVAHSPDKGTV